MSNGFLSQEEIDSLLNGGGSQTEVSASSETDKEELLTDIEKDILGEVGNISMGSASTALSTIIGQQVNITTPVVTITTLKELRDGFEIPNIALDVRYTSGILGSNLLVMKVSDAAVIASLMMGGDGTIDENPQLTEIETSAVSEAMNQMIGSAATSMATMFAREVNISPPTSKIWTDGTSNLSESIGENEGIVLVSFKLTIGNLIDSTIMQILPVQTAKKIVTIMMGTEENLPTESNTTSQEQETKSVSKEAPKSSREQVAQNRDHAYDMVREKPIENNPVNVKQASFQELQPFSMQDMPRNIDLILDVPLDISVVLGRAKMNIRDVLDLGSGSLIELDKLAEEPVEILVNGKKVAYGEVVVVDENFGVRVTSIISNEERVKTLGK